MKKQENKILIIRGKSAFFDYDMDGVLDLYMMYAGGSGNLCGEIYSYENGEFQNIGREDLEGDYEVFRNDNNEYLFLKDRVVTYGGGRDTEVSKYDLKTKTETLLAYQQEKFGEDGWIEIYEDAQNNEIDKATYERIISDATEGYRKVEWEWDVINVRTKEDTE